MSALAIAAGASLPEFTLMPEDLPARSGFMYFDQPVATADLRDVDETPLSEAPIVAACWGPWTGNNPAWKHGGIWVTWYSDARAALDSGVRIGTVSGRLAEKLRPVTDRLAIDNEIQCPFSPDPIPAMTANGGETASYFEAGGIARWLGTLKAAWLLMTQPVTAVTDAQYDKATRRRLAKNHPKPPRVRVINLRRPAGTSTSGSDREYQHQWIVRGHWRQQWYATRNVHRPVWIAPHVKGPEGAPLLGGEKVYAWTR
ncbi:hypothetical protein [Rhizocola hellebori]|nr:hypothetical protein [Rhizocola hellebori]